MFGQDEQHFNMEVHMPFVKWLYINMWLHFSISVNPETNNVSLTSTIETISMVFILIDITLN